MFALLRRRERPVSYVVMALLGAVAVFTWRDRLSATAGDQQALGHADFWRPLIVFGVEAEKYDSLDTMAKSAESVVLGSIVDFKLSRQLQGDAAEDIVSYGVATVKVREHVRGAPVESEIPVEFLVPDVAAPIEDVIAAQAGNLPKGELLLFVRRKTGRNEKQFYRIVNSTGLWSQSARGGVRTPLTPGADVDDSVQTASNDSNASWRAHSGEVRYAREIAGAATVQQLATRVRK